MSFRPRPGDTLFLHELYLPSNIEREESSAILSYYALVLGKDVAPSESEEAAEDVGTAKQKAKTKNPFIRDEWRLRAEVQV